MQMVVYVIEGGFVWCDQVCFGVYFDCYVVQGYMFFYVQIVDCFVVEFNYMVGVVGVIGFINDGQYDIFGGNVWCCFVLDFDFYGFCVVLFQGLGCQYMFYFGGVDIECQCIECVVGGGMGVIVYDCYFWQGNFLFWVYDVDDVLIWVVQVVQFNVEFFIVFNQFLYLNVGYFIGCVNVFGLC